MTDKFEEWDQKLAQVDKAISRLPAKGPTPGREGPPAAKSAAAPAGTTRAGITRPAERPLGVWVRVGLTAILAAALTQWPFARGCGLGLYGYLGAVGVVIGSGLWGAGSTWRLRLPKAHLLALATVLAGLVLVALEVLPRIGYASQVLRWTCG